MSTRRSLFIMVLVAAMAVVPWSIDRVAANPQGVKVQRNNNEMTITDAAGRDHRVMAMRGLTPAQRKAAADRAHATRKAKAGTENGAAPASMERGPK